MGSSSFLSVFLEPLLLLGLIVHILRLDLHHHYRWFFIYLVKSLLIILLADTMGVHSHTYCSVYWSTRPIDLALSTVMAKEVVNGICGYNPGLRWLGRDLLWLLVGLSSMLGFIGTYGFEWVTARCSNFGCQYVKFLHFQYFTLTGLIVFLILINWQLRRVARVQWNETVYSAMLIFDFLLKVILPLLLFASRGKHVDTINMIARNADLFWCFLGIVLLRKAMPGVTAVKPVSLEEYLRGLKSYQEVLYRTDRARQSPQIAHEAVFRERIGDNQ